MIRVKFYGLHGILKGFELSGHAGYAESGSDIVCAAVSSAVQLTVNNLIGLGFEPDVNVGENIIKCRITSAKDASLMLGIFKQHIEAVLEEFPGTIKITISEV